MDNKPFMRKPSVSFPGMGIIPPQAIDLEEAVLGALLIEKFAINEVINILSPDSFYKEANEKIYRAIIELFSKSEPIDILTVTNNLRTKGYLEIVGGPFYITELTTKINSSANIEYHARIIAEKAIKRQLIVMCSETMKSCYDEMVDSLDLIDDTQAAVYKISNTINSGETKEMRTVIRTVMENMAKAMKLPDGITGIPSGFTDIDKITGGWQRSDLIIVAARPGMGKAQPLFSKVLTENGWKPMGDIQIGERVAGKNGDFNNVTGVFPQGELDIYKVSFSDGTFTYCCEEHLWQVESREDRKSGRGVQVLPLKKIKEKININQDNRLNYSIPYCDPIKFKKKFLPLDPYLLGSLLGDGSFTGGTIKLTNPEKDITGILSESLPETDILEMSSVNEIDFCIKKKINGKYKTSTFNILESLGLAYIKTNEKYIPHSYLMSDINDRVELLRGLLDTDGFIEKEQTNIEFSTVSPQLKNDIIFLVQSLGGRATFKKKTGKYKKEAEDVVCQDYYRINLSLNCDIIPFHSNKNTAKFKIKTRVKNKYLSNVEYAGKFQCQCIKVDAEDSLYITDDFIVTHNTAYVVNNVRNTAIKFGLPVAMFSLEMSAEQLVTRMIASEIDDIEISTNKMVRGRISDEEFAHISKRINLLSAANIFIDDSAGLSINQLKSKCHRLKIKHDIQLIVVDYLQLMSGSGKGNGKGPGNREQEISEIARGLKNIAKSLNVPVIALSQLSRAVETRGGDKRPQLSDLRESGSIEQDADVVCFLYRPEYYKIDEDEQGNSLKGIGEFIIHKHRNGPLETILLRYIGRQTKFKDMEEEPASVFTFEPSTAFNDSTRR